MMIRVMALAVIWFTAACCAVLAVWWVVRTVQAWRYSWQHARHVIALGRAAGAATVAGLASVDEQVVPYAPVEGHPPWPINEEDIDAFYVARAVEARHPDWREQTAADLSPEALDRCEDCGAPTDQGHHLEGWSGMASPAQGGQASPRHPSDDSGPGEGKPPGPAQVSESDWTAPPVAKPWPVDTGASGGQGFAATAVSALPPADERLPASLPAIERAFAETMSRLWADVHGWAGEPWAVRMPWEVAA